MTKNSRRRKMTKSSLLLGSVSLFVALEEVELVFVEQ
jgi:hypothetical protein